MRGGKGTQKWTPLNKGRGSKLVEHQWRSFMDDDQFIFKLQQGNFDLYLKKNLLRKLT